MIIREFVDEIYAAALAPEQWRRVLNRMASVSDAEGTVLFTVGPEGIRWISTCGICDLVRDWISSEWVVRNERGRRLIPRKEQRFLTDLDAFTLEELDREPFYRDFLRPRGLGWCAGTAIELPSGSVVVFSIEKAHKKGPVAQEVIDLLNSIRPHLVRSVGLAAGGAINRVQTSLHALQSAGVAAAVLRRDGSVVEKNLLFSKCSPAIVSSHSNRVAFSGASAQSAFRKALEALDKKTGPLLYPRPIALSASDPGGPLLAYLLPFEALRDDIFLGSTALLIVVRFEEQSVPSEQLLMELFELTPTEARVVSLLVHGASVKAIARAQRVTANTVRMQLKSVYGKTGAHRQAQLVGLLARTSLYWPPTNIRPS